MRIRSSWLWAAVLAGHLIGAVGWWWMMPGGFAVSHPRFWVNQVWPIVAGIVSAMGLVMAIRRRWEAVRAVLVGLCGVWAGVGITGGFLFGHSRAVVLVAPFFAAAVVFVAGVGLGKKRGWRSMAGVAVLGAVVGGFLMTAQRGGEASTRPANPADGLRARSALPAQAGPAGQAVGRLSDSVRVDGIDRTVTVAGGRMLVSVRPMLTFISRSADRGWSSWAQRSDRIGPECQMVAGAINGPEFLGVYSGDGRSALRVRTMGGGAAAKIGADIEAESKLPSAVYSHLNSFCQIAVAGHQKLSLEFSPCPGRRIEVTAFDYPIGRPARFAYLGRDGVFRVVQARSGEKGPFTELAGGPMPADGRLAITMYDGDEAVSRVTLEDWAAQAGMELSPTAGWGVPVNAIEFSLNDSRPGSAAVIYVTLAGTSVGRGWDTVGHAPGVYRNRMRVEVK